MRDKIENELKNILEKKESYLKELQNIEQTRQNITAQVIACNGAIEALEKLIEANNDKTVEK